MLRRSVPFQVSKPPNLPQNVVQVMHEVIDYPLLCGGVEAPEPFGISISEIVTLAAGEENEVAELVG